jgi:two-component system sensor histidine kinase/response regulator
MKTSVSPHLLHDLRNPLNQIIGYSELLTENAEEVGTREEVLVDLQRLRDAGRRMLALIEGNFVAHPELLPADVAADVPHAGDVTLRDHRAVAPGLLLVVDDDAANRDVLSRRLQQQGHEVRTASSGDEALRMMREEPFDVVLLDIIMPDIDGYEVLSQIKADDSLRHLPVIMISAIDEVHSVVRCIEAGADDYLAKPFDPTLLRARIGASLEKKRGRDREAVMYAQLQENYTRLQELETLRDDMRNMIVHDLRTPLTAVIVGVEMLGSHGVLSESQRDMIGIAASGGRTLLGMINDLLDVEKMESGPALLQYTPLSAAALVAGAVEQVSSLAAMENTNLVSDVAPELPAFAGDANMLGRTLVNLIANAIKFTRAGTVTIRAWQEGESICFAVRDTGAGIPSASFERIFEKFGQLDAGHRVGTGLGLAFCKLAVEAHRGHIEVQSVVGEGSTFSFSIPVAAA